MPLRAAHATLVACLVSAGCGDGGTGSTDAAGDSDAFIQDAVGTDAAGTDAVADAAVIDASADAPIDAGSDAANDAASADAPADAPTIPGVGCQSATGYAMYLHRSGGTYFPGTGLDAPAANRSNMLDVTRTMAAWPYSDTNWQQLVACVGLAMAPYNVRVTDSEPTTGEYLEVVFTDTSFGSAGDAWVVRGNCTSARVSQISFVFGNVTGDDPVVACRAALWTIGRISGLDYSLLPCDVMSMESCPSNTWGWTNSPAQCGTSSPRNCDCDNLATQNSRQRMNFTWGPCLGP